METGSQNDVEAQASSKRNRSRKGEKRAYLLGVALFGVLVESARQWPVAHATALFRERWLKTHDAEWGL